MLQPTIKLNKNLWTKVKKCSEAAGYSTPKEFVEHVLEREVAKLENTAGRKDASSDKDIANKLRGLGYLE
jgi:hypothetical protein